jgi:hypothetical protein
MGTTLLLLSFLGVWHLFGVSNEHMLEWVHVSTVCAVAGLQGF